MRCKSFKLDRRIFIHGAKEQSAGCSTERTRSPRRVWKFKRWQHVVETPRRQPTRVLETQNSVTACLQDRESSGLPRTGRPHSSIPAEVSVSARLHARGFHTAPMLPARTPENLMQAEPHAPVKRYETERPQQSPHGAAYGREACTTIPDRATPMRSRRAQALSYMTSF